MLHKPTHTGCPCGHLEDAECVRHKPLLPNPCAAYGYACRKYDLRDRICQSVCVACDGGAL